MKQYDETQELADDEIMQMNCWYLLNGDKPFKMPYTLTSGTVKKHCRNVKKITYCDVYKRRLCTCAWYDYAEESD